MNRILATLGALLAAVSTAGAASYHVSASSGHDDHPGTEAAPWRSVAKVNAFTFAPGDRVLFRRGETWSGAGLIVSSDGVPDRPVFYGAYGSGEKPVLRESPGAGVRLAGRRHIEIADFSLVASSGQGLTCENSNHVALRRIDVSDNVRGPGIVATQGGHILVDGCTVTNANNNGILFKGSLEARLHDSTIQDCVVRHTRANDGIVLHNAATFVETVGARIVLRRNRSEGNREQGFDITSGSHVLLEDNESSANHGGGMTLGHAASHLTIRRHYSHDERGLGVKISVPHVVIEHSRFTGGSGTAPLVLIQPTLNTQVRPAVVDAQPEDVVLRDNEFVWNSETGGNALLITRTNRTPEGTFFDPTLRRLTLERNRWTSRSGVAIAFNFPAAGPSPDLPTFTLRGNTYAAGATWIVGEVRYANFAAYRARFDPDGSWEEQGDAP